MVKKTPIIQFFEAHNKAEKQLLENVLKQILNRKITNDDFVYLTATVIDTLSYNLMFLDKSIGTVKKNYDKSPAFEFIPKTNE